MTSKASPEPQGTTGTARIMAPFALVIAVLVVAIVIAGSVGGSDGDDGRGGDRTRRGEPGPREDTYVVQSGDNLSVIASKYGIEASAIQQCNPDIDPQNLQPSLKIKLRC